MKMYRAGRTSSKWSVTDNKSPDQYKDRLASEGSVRFDGTIEKLGERHTELRVKFEAEDFVPLTAALSRRATPEEISEVLSTIAGQLVSRVSRLESDVKALRGAMAKIYSLSRNHNVKAPSTEELVEAMSEIAFFYEDEDAMTLDDDPKQWTVEWIKWDEI